MTRDSPGIAQDDRPRSPEIARDRPRAILQVLHKCAEQQLRTVERLGCVAWKSAWLRVQTKRAVSRSSSSATSCGAPLASPTTRSASAPPAPRSRTRHTHSRESIGRPPLHHPVRGRLANHPRRADRGPSSSRRPPRCMGTPIEQLVVGVHRLSSRRRPRCCATSPKTAP